MEEILCKLLRDLIVGLWSELDPNHIRFQPSSLLGADSKELERQLHLIMHIRDRAIMPRPREVLLPQGFCVPRRYRQAFQEIERRLLAGEQMWPHCSRSLFSVEADEIRLSDHQPGSRDHRSARIEREKFLDGLYQRWNIVHFHLGTSLIQQGPQRGFVQGTRDLLYAYVDSERVYCIGILPHGHWMDRDFLQVLGDNWPELLSQWELKGITGDTLSQEEFENLCRKNVNACLSVNGRAIAPGGPVALDGYSMRTRLSVMKTMATLKHHAELWDEFLTGTQQSLLTEIRNLPDPTLQLTSINWETQQASVLCDWFDKPISLKSGDNQFRFERNEDGSLPLKLVA